MNLTPKTRALLERLGRGKKLLPAQITDAASARKLLNAGYAQFVDDQQVKDWSRGGSPAQVLIITESGQQALK